MAPEIKVVEVVTLFGFAKKGKQIPEQLFKTSEGRDAELERKNSFTFQFSCEMDINIDYREPIDVLTARTEDGRYFRLVDVPRELLKE